MLNWDSYPNFSAEEMACQETGKQGIDPEFMDWLQTCRTRCGFPFNVVSGYRAPGHSIEAAKEVPGEHSDGWAADISVPKWRVMTFLEVMFASGIRRLGMHSATRGQVTFHIGMSPDRPPAFWTY